MTILIKNLKWDTFTVLVSSYYENILTLEVLKKKFDNFQINSLIYDPSISETMMSTLIKRFIKVVGVRNLLVLDRGESLKLCIKILKHTKMNKYGNYFVFGTSNIFSIDLEGAMIIETEGTQESKAVEDFYSIIVTDIIQKLTKTNLTIYEFTSIRSANFSNLAIFNFNKITNDSRS